MKKTKNIRVTVARLYPQEKSNAKFLNDQFELNRLTWNAGLNFARKSKVFTSLYTEFFKYYYQDESVSSRFKHHHKGITAWSLKVLERSFEGVFKNGRGFPKFKGKDNPIQCFFACNKSSKIYNKKPGSFKTGFKPGFKTFLKLSSGRMALHDGSETPNPPKSRDYLLRGGDLQIKGEFVGTFIIKDAKGFWAHLLYDISPEDLPEKTSNGIVSSVISDEKNISVLYSQKFTLAKEGKLIFMGEEWAKKYGRKSPVVRIKPGSFYTEKNHIQIYSEYERINEIETKRLDLEKEKGRKIKEKIREKNSLKDKEDLMKIRLLYQKLRNIKITFSHKVSCELSKSSEVIFIEEKPENPNVCYNRLLGHLGYKSRYLIKIPNVPEGKNRNLDLFNNGIEIINNLKSTKELSKILISKKAFDSDLDRLKEICFKIKNQKSSNITVQKKDLERISKD